MGRKYFGTDGIRGEANRDLNIDIVTNLGLALGYYLRKNKTTEGKPKVILGTDTRISGYMILLEFFQLQVLATLQDIYMQMLVL